MNYLFTTQNKLMLAVIIFWSLPWKGYALWRSSQRKEVGWFIALFLINTFGVLEILYLFVFTKWIDKKRMHQGTLEEVKEKKGD